MSAPYPPRSAPADQVRGPSFRRAGRRCWRGPGRSRHNLDDPLDCLAQLTVLPIGKMRLQEFADREIDL